MTPIRTIAAWLAAAAALVACATVRDNGTAMGGASVRTPTISVLTLNLYHDRDDWPRRREQIVSTLRTLRPDAIALQEVLEHESLRNQAEFLAGELGYQVHFVSTDPPGRPRRYGNAILTPHRILDRGEAFLRPLEDSRTAAYVRIAVGGHAVDIYATHLHHTPEGSGMRAQQLRDLLAFIDGNSADAPSIVAGDFNATTDAAELAALAPRFASSHDRLHPGANRDQRAHTTLNPFYFKDRQRRIDHVYYEDGRFVPVASRIVLDRPDPHGVWPSDHFGLLATFRIAGPGTTGRLRGLR